MNSILKNTLVLTLILALFSSCSKFEDGPKISFRSIEKRIYGIYRIEYFSKNSTDLTDYWNQYYDLEFEIRNTTDFHANPFGMKVSGCMDSCGFCKPYGTYLYSLDYKYENGEASIIMNNYMYDSAWYPNRYLYPIIIDMSTPYTDRFYITRLTMDELWLEHTNGSDFYEIHFKE